MNNIMRANKAFDNKKRETEKFIEKQQEEARQFFEQSQLQMKQQAVKKFFADEDLYFDNKIYTMTQQRLADDRLKEELANDNMKKLARKKQIAKERSYKAPAKSGLSVYWSMFKGLAKSIVFIIAATSLAMSIMKTLGNVADRLIHPSKYAHEKELKAQRKQFDKDFSLRQTVVDYINEKKFINSMFMKDDSVVAGIVKKEGIKSHPLYKVYNALKYDNPMSELHMTDYKMKYRLALMGMTESKRKELAAMSPAKAIAHFIAFANDIPVFKKKSARWGNKKQALSLLDKGELALKQEYALENAGYDNSEDYDTNFELPSPFRPIFAN